MCVVVLVLLVIHSCASVLLANLLYQEDLQTVGCLFLLFCCSCGSVWQMKGLARRGSKCFCANLGPPRAIKGSRRSNLLAIGLKILQGLQ